MASETINLIGYTIVGLVLIILIGGMVYQKIQAIQNKDDFNMVYASSDMALLIDALYAAPYDVEIHYLINYSNLDYYIKTGEVVAKKSTSFGPYAKQSHFRFSYSNGTKINESFFSFTNKSIEFYIKKQNSKIFIINSSEAAVLENSVSACPVVAITKANGESDIILDFPMVGDASDPMKGSSEFVRSTLNLIDFSKSILHNTPITSPSYSFDNVLQDSKGKLLYVHVKRNPSITGAHIYFKEQNEDYAYLSCILKSAFSSESNLQISYGFTNENDNFNKIESKYVVVIELGDEYGKSIPAYDLSNEISKFLGDAFK